jgi:transposase-like protein
MNPTYFFCPNNKCTYNQKLSYKDKWFRKDGYHPTKAFGPIQRYRCLHCGKTFSDQTFSLNYYLKKATDFDQLLKQLNSNNSSCFIARENKMSFESIRIRRDRMARNALFFQSTMQSDLVIDEPLCADGFESYTKSKYYPTNINILIGSESGYLYYFTESHSRRKGKVTAKQKERMEWEYEDKSFQGCDLYSNFSGLLSILKGMCKDNSCVLHTDEHKTYPSVLDDLSKAGGFPVVQHIKTSSKRIRNGQNPLHRANTMDMLFRKDLPNHRRRTICFARNDRNMLSRIALYTVTHNFFKPKYISDKAKQTQEKHYSTLGFDEEKVAFWKSLFTSNRFFLSKVQLPAFFLKVWKRITDTPFGENWYPLPKFALD